MLVIELDDRLVQHLKKEFAGITNLSIEHSDALAYRYGLLDGPWKIVANLPYYISTPIIQRLIEHRATFSTLTLLLQKEVAERIASPPGSKEYGFLSVLVQLYTEPRLEFRVPANAFTPRPDVDSEVVTLSVRPRPAVTIQSEPFFFRLVKAAFSQRRKTLRNSLKQLGIAKEDIRAAQAETGIDLSRRAETLSVKEFGILADFLVTI